MSPDRSNPRGIDGIILSKYVNKWATIDLFCRYDTVDEKVGAALSLVYITGEPIVFVGVGERYTDLRSLNVKDVARVLMA